MAMGSGLVFLVNTFVKISKIFVRVLLGGSHLLRFLVPEAPGRCVRFRRRLPGDCGDVLEPHQPRVIIACMALCSMTAL